MPIEIIDILGRNIYSKIVKMENSDNVRDKIHLIGLSLVTGTYVVMVTTDNTEQYKQKVVILK